MNKLEIRSLFKQSIENTSGFNGDINDCVEIIDSLKKEKIVLKTEVVSLSELANWDFDKDTGNFFHSSGKFFSYIGANWNDKKFPLILQPEIGILGFLTASFDGVLHFLVQLKQEPGDPNGVQLSPTVQATKSNYSQVHGGNLTKFLEFFLSTQDNKVLYDQYQSEQGWRYYKKRNRNMILFTDCPPEQGENHLWMTMGQIKHFLEQPLAVNFCARSVLAMLPALFSHASEFERYEYMTDKKLESNFLDKKNIAADSAKIVDLNTIKGWNYQNGSISSKNKNNYSMIGVKVEGIGREIPSWNQPLLMESSKGEYGLLIGEIKNTKHIFWKLRNEPGLIDKVELGPSWINRSEQDESKSIGYLRSLSAQIIICNDLAEDGGRFYHSIISHKIFDVGDVAINNPLLNDLTPLTVKQTNEFMTKAGYFTSESRSLWSLLKEDKFV